jgi:serine/threonine protein kinase/Flp pilus assembly protein TadD
MISKTILHYKIIKKLGEGGMGVVYLAEDTRLERKVAIKFLPRQIAANVEERQRFVVRAKHSQQRISSEQKDDARNASPQRPQEARLPINQIINIAAQIAEGLHAAHEKGVVHRDIKSGNIMVTESGQVKVMDLGLAKVAGSGAQLTKDHSTLGTAAYMSPEQARGEAVDHRSDIWSFGVVLYEMFTGNLPFPGEYEQAVLYAILNSSPEPLIGLTMEQEQLVEKCLAKDPQERYQNMNEILSDLKLLSGKSDTPAPYTMPGRDSQVSRPGLREKKGVFIAILVLTIAVVLTWQQFFIPSAPDVNARKSIAVLPFKNLSDDKENEYFSDGITEDIIARLSRLSELRVMSRSAIEHFKNSERSFSEMAAELDVTAILEGSVRRSGNRVRIVSQLVDARSEENIWVGTYDRDLQDIFEIQSDVSKRIAEALQARLSPAEQAQLQKKSTENLDAYNLYLQGRYHWRKRKAAGLEKAADYFERAIALDSSYTLAYVGLADAYALFPFYDAGTLSQSEAFDEAEKMAQKALALDPELAAAHTSLGNIMKEKAGKAYLKKAEQEFQRAFALNPDDANAHQWYAELLMMLGRNREAINHARTAHRLEPYSAVIGNALGLSYLFNRQYNEAIRQFNNTLEIDPTLPALYGNLMWCYIFTKQAEKANAAAQRFVDLAHEWVKPYKLLVENRLMEAFIDAAINPTAKDETLIRQIDSLFGKPGAVLPDETSFFAATIYALENQKALHWLEAAYKTKTPGLFFIASPMFDSIRQEPRYVALLKKTGLSE